MEFPVVVIVAGTLLFALYAWRFNVRQRDAELQNSAGIQVTVASNEAETEAGDLAVETCVASPLARSMTASEKQYWEQETLAMYEEADKAIQKYERKFPLSREGGTSEPTRKA